jgi:hypothetical protein
MKAKTIITTALVLSFIVCFAAAVADLSGKWTGTLKTPDGSEFPLSYTFKLDGDKLTGTGSGPNGDTPITAGKVNGTDFTFNLNVNDADIAHTCKYYSDGDSISVNINFNGAKMHAQLKRDTK